MNGLHIYRFIERDFWLARVGGESELLSSADIEAMLKECGTEWHDLTFKFYGDGSVDIIDNDTGGRLVPSELTGACYDFYVRKRIELIKAMLREPQLQSA